jgi:uncharacterized repeat protein (TIGR01451 family)
MRSFVAIMRRSPLMRRIALTVLASVFIVTSVAVAPALASPWWHIRSETVPTNLPPGGQGEFIVAISNLGDAPVEGDKEQVTITDKLPAGLEATTITGQIKNHVPVECTVATLTCTFKGVLYPYEQTTVAIKVKVTVGAMGSLSGQASVEGGGVTKVTRKLTIPVGGEPAPYGPEEYEVAPYNEDGTSATQAGAHPFQLTTTLALNQTFLPEGGRQPVELPKDLAFHLPAGLVGNPNAVSQCTMPDFFALVYETNLCSPGSVVGVATVTADEPKALKVFTKTVPVFNLVPAQGEPARFGLEAAGKVPIVIDASVRSGKDYGVDVSVQNATQTAGLLSSQVTFWGVPGDPRHDNARGWECVAGGTFAKQAGRPCPGVSKLPEEPFLTLPTSCAVDPQSEPVLFPMLADSWAHPGSFLGAEYAWMNSEGQRLGFEGCGELAFEPSIDVTPEERVASTPTGVDVSVTMPQTGTLQEGGRAEADVRDTTVTLPRGVELSPSAANGLEGCSEAQIGYIGVDQTSQTDEFNTREAGCPNGSKVGTVRIKTPLLSHELEGGVYLASPAPNGEAGQNPFNSLVALYIVAEDPVSGVLVKLAGEGHVDEGTLQISTSFRNTPQVPFEELSMHLFGGQRASLTTPATCGAYATSALFTPWSDPEEVSEVSPLEPFAITAGVGGSACPAGGLGFSPGFTAYSQDTRAGAFTGFTMELSHPDGDQALSSVSMHLPSGVAALLSSVELCSEAQAAVSACPAGSEVGEAIAIAGLGSEPYVQKGGRVYITERYGDAPFGLEIVTPAKAGPFDLGYITVRSKLYVDPNDASVRIVSNPLPTEIRGIPLQLKRVIVSVNRPGFEFNPTSCEPMSIEGTITGAEGGSASVSAPFQTGDCASLPFSPQLTASAFGRGSKADGTTFAVTVRSGGVDANGVAQAGIAKVQLQLPKQLSSRLPTLQKACADSVFNANPASCDEGSVIGYAAIHTPVLKNPLTGPAYLVSHGGAAFPDVEFLLQGEGIELVLDGRTDIKGEVTYSRFESAPDAPFTVFETVLPAGPHGVLTPNVAESKRFSLCGESLVMPTTMIAQNGMRIDRETKVQVTGCGEVRSAKTSRLTLKQKLKRSLRSCRHKYRHAKRKRQRCERQAHAHYTRLALAACRHQVRHVKQRKKCERAARAKFGLRGKKAVHRKRSGRS